MRTNRRSSTQRDTAPGNESHRREKLNVNTHPQFYSPNQKSILERGAGDGSLRRQGLRTKRKITFLTNLIFP